MLTSMRPMAGSIKLPDERPNNRPSTGVMAGFVKPPTNQPRPGRPSGGIMAGNIKLPDRDVFVPSKSTENEENNAAPAEKRSKFKQFFANVVNKVKNIFSKGTPDGVDTSGRGSSNI